MDRYKNSQHKDFNEERELEDAQREDSQHERSRTGGLDKLLNTVAEEDFTIYPPGIPIVLKGEIFTQEKLEQIKRMIDEDR